MGTRRSDQMVTAETYYVGLGTGTKDIERMTSQGVSDPRPDWQNTRSVVECNRYMLENQIQCDVDFILQTGTGRPVQISAHRYVLMSRNPVFFAMFSGPLAETGKEIRISDVTPLAFRLMLRYLYHEEIELTMDTVFPLLYTCKKYLVTSLAEHCIDFLEKTATPENVCTILEYDFLLLDDEVALREKCWQLIQRQTKRVLDSHAFYQTTQDTLCRILECDKLSVREIDIFRACALWAEHKCAEEGVEVTAENKRGVLGRALFLVRIPSMALADFSQGVVSSGMLTMEEENGLYRHLMGEEPGRALSFPTEARQYTSSKCTLHFEAFVRHNTSLGGRYDGFLHRSRWSLTLSCDHNILLSEVGFLGNFKGSFSVSQNGLCKLEATCDSSMRQMHFEDEVQIEAGTFTISNDTPFSFSGEYYSKSILAPLPRVDSNQEHVSIRATESSSTCFISYIAFRVGEDLNFIEDYFELGFLEMED